MEVDNELSKQDKQNDHDNSATGGTSHFTGKKYLWRNKNHTMWVILL